MKIQTKDTEGRPNGYIIPIWSAMDRPELRPDQVYVTAIAPRTRKGPHLHLNRRGFFTVISGGEVLVRQIIMTGNYAQIALKPGDGFTVISAGLPCALYNYGDTEALVLNLPSPAWSAEDPDEHPVLNWQDPEDWPIRNDCGCPHPDSSHDSGGVCRESFCECQGARR